MQEVIATKGMGFGRISPVRTLATMEVGEVWSTRDVTAPVLRVAASRYGQLTGRRFSVNAYDENLTTVTRTL